jgi:hypothetical protein
MPIAAIGLSAREAQILRQFVRGSSTTAIARDLAISHRSVKAHFREIRRKRRRIIGRKRRFWSSRAGSCKAVAASDETVQAFLVHAFLPRSLENSRWMMP